MSSPAKKPSRAVLMTARLITLVVSLAGAEGMLWLGGYPSWWAMDPQWGGASHEYQCDPDLGWKLREGIFDLGWPGHNIQFRYTNWSEGRRATIEDGPPAVVPNQPQVMFFGDSYIQGYGLSDFETLPWIIQKRHPEVQVTNFGAGNYGTYQSYLTMRKWIHGPVSAYYMFNGFHEGRNAADPAWLRLNQKPPAGCFYPYVVESGGGLREYRSTGNVVWPLSRKFRIVALVQDYRDIIASYFRVHNTRKVTEALLVKMQETVRAQGGKFTVILFDLSPDQRQDYKKFLESEGIAFVNCDHPDLKDKSLRLPDGHPSLGLNARLASWMEPLVVVPERPSEARSVDEGVVGKNDHRFARVADKLAPVQ